MTDQRFLAWLHQRLVHQHGDSENMDFMGKLRSIIVAIPEEQETTNTAPDITHLIGDGS